MVIFFCSTIITYAMTKPFLALNLLFTRLTAWLYLALHWQGFIVNHNVPSLAMFLGFGEHWLKEVFHALFWHKLFLGYVHIAWYNFKYYKIMINYLYLDNIYYKNSDFDVKFLIR